MNLEGLQGVAKRVNDRSVFLQKMVEKRSGRQLTPLDRKNTNSEQAKPCSADVSPCTTRRNVLKLASAMITEAFKGPAKTTMRVTSPVKKLSWTNSNHHKLSWTDKSVSVQCRNFSKKRTRFTVISI
mmetsp:Transcript_14913/g.20211  ORF Transcript_14913/g.20211 Transcript_14913/m.20211 type:complete len:127 (+) Transcript_14913:639-1019(+)